MVFMIVVFRYYEGTAGIFPGWRIEWRSMPRICTGAARSSPQQEEQARGAIAQQKQRNTLECQVVDCWMRVTPQRGPSLFLSVLYNRKIRDVFGFNLIHTSERNSSLVPKELRTATQKVPDKIGNFFEKWARPLRYSVTVAVSL